MNGTLKWNSSGTSNRKSSIRWTVEKAAKATAEMIVGECHLEGFKSDKTSPRSMATQVRKAQCTPNGLEMSRPASQG